MDAFDYQSPTRVVFGAGTLSRLGELASELGARRALVVSDPGIVSAGHTGRAVDSLGAAGLESFVYDGVVENPTTANVDAGVAFAKECEPDLLVGLGGGSSMDCAKGINFIHSCGGRMQDYWGIGKATADFLPMIAVPTTAGTGSETQSFALITDAETHVKMACGDRRAACRVAILDPELTLTQPTRVTAVTGIDALAHAIETYVTTKRNAVSLAFSRQAWSLLSENFSRVLEAPDDLEARAGMQLGASFAGMAIENSMLGATHALANPLTAKYGIVHGEAISLMLPHVIRFNAETCDRWYHDLWSSTDGTGANGKGSGAHLAEVVERFVAEAELPSSLSSCDIPREALPELAEGAAKQWTGQFNPRPVGRDELLSIYQSAF